MSLWSLSDIVIVKIKGFQDPIRARRKSVTVGHRHAREIGLKDRLEPQLVVGAEFDRRG